MPVEFDCPVEEGAWIRPASHDPSGAPRTDTPPPRSATEPYHVRTYSARRAAVVVGLAALVAAFAIALFQFVGLARKEMALEEERQLLVGRCFDNGIGGVGRLIEVWKNDRGLLAFPDGHTTPYPFASITEVTCPARASRPAE